MDFLSVRLSAPLGRRNIPIGLLQHPGGEILAPSTSAAARPAAPPPKITTEGGELGGLFVFVSGYCASAGSLSRTKTLLPTRSTRQRGIASNAGADEAMPVRRLKQAWCRGSAAHRRRSTPLRGDHGNAYSQLRLQRIRPHGEPKLRPHPRLCIGSFRHSVNHLPEIPL